jgi:hypothetical protein
LRWNTHRFWTKESALIILKTTSPRGDVERIRGEKCLDQMNVGEEGSCVLENVVEYVSQEMERK